MTRTRRSTILLALVCALATVGTAALAAEYKVTVTNVTKGQTFTPLLVVSHRANIELFEPGTAASAEIEAVAEAGDIMPLDALVGTLPQVYDTNTNGGLLGPGESVTIPIHAGGKFDRISFVGMLIPTNDTFVGLRSLQVSPRDGVRGAYAIAYDAGTEFNDQNCANIPGPRCMGEGLSAPADDDEGFIHVGNGFHDLNGTEGGEGEVLGPFQYDWRNPVAHVRIERVSGRGDDDDEDDSEDDEYDDD